MKPGKLSANLLLIFIVLLSIITLLYDLLEYYSATRIDSWSYINEFFSVSALLLFFVYLKSRKLFSHDLVQKNLINIVKLLAGLYLVVFIAQQLLDPSFSPAVFPNPPETLPSLIYANLIALSAIIMFMPLLLSIRNLMYFKHRRRTTLYITLVLAGTALNSLFTIITNAPPAISVSLDYNYRSLSGDNSLFFFLNNAVYLINLVLLFILATRNSWVTFLSRRDKYIYFLLSLAIISAIIFLYDFVFGKGLAYHSLTLAVFANLAYFFLIFYTILASFNLLLQLPTARVFERKMREVSSLHRLSQAIAAEFDYNKVIQMITEMATEVTESKFTWFEIKDEHNGRLSIVASKNLTAAEISHFNRNNNNPVSHQILSGKKSVLVNHLSKSPEYVHLNNWKKSIGSFLGVPVMNSKDQVLGILFAAKSENFGYDPDDVNMLEAYANQAGIAIENSKLIQNSLERERMEKELQIAREVQMRLLPQTIPSVGRLEIETLTITAYEVGGDYYDFYNHTGDEIGLIIGDVSGKGTSAAFYMAETKGIIQSLASIHASPREILINTNKILYRSLDRKIFISLLTARINTRTMELTYARAGHCPVIHYSGSAGRSEILQPPGIAVGLNQGEIFDQILTEEVLTLQNGDILAFFTDGLSEARNELGEEFGEERLSSFLSAHAALSIVELKDRLIDEILRFLNGQNLHDDLTLILIKI